LQKYLTREQLPISDSGKSVPVCTYFINDIKETGFYSLTIQSQTYWSPQERLTVLNNTEPDCILVVYNYDNIEIETSLNSYLMKVGNEVGLYAQILKDGKSARQLIGNHEVVVVSKADMVIQTPNGKETDVPMNDDGVFGDKIRGDHIYSASVETHSSGSYRLSAVLRGYISDKDGNKRPFLKTAEHFFSVSPNSVELIGDAWLTVVDSERANIHLYVLPDSGITDPRGLGSFRAYTEVYGFARDGSMKPAAWLGSVVTMQLDSTSKYPYFTLQLNLKWLSHSNLKGPLTLKNTYLSDGSTHFPVTTYEEDIKVKNSHVHNMSIFSHVLSMPGPLEITDEMQFGVNPLKKPSLNETANGPTLILVHGYCAESNPFQKNANVFTNAAFFLHANANMNNDQFAAQIHQFAQSKGSSLYSLIAHSQGGMASLHLLNTYWSGLDHVSSGRRIQTIGTPWKGNSAAGSTANLGKLFGVGCGPNHDLTRDGAKNWFAGIHESHPQYVHYYTTTYKQGSALGDYCNLAINSLLQWPNDGVSELIYAKLDNGKPMGNIEKYCHTTGMKYTAQYYDNARNSDMNAKAGRY